MTQTAARPEVQIIANVVARDPSGRVLFVRYDPDDERWWLPGRDLEPYEHPDDAARSVVAGVSLRVTALRMTHVESFRGRRGWHLVLHYRADVEGDPAGDAPAAWHAADALPRTAHGNWEHDAVARALA